MYWLSVGLSKKKFGNLEKYSQILPFIYFNDHMSTVTNKIEELAVEFYIADQICGF